MQNINITYEPTPITPIVGPVVGAVRYRIRLFNDDLTFDQSLNNDGFNVPEVGFNNVPDGNYTVTVITQLLTPEGDYISSDIRNGDNITTFTLPLI